MSFDDLFNHKLLIVSGKGGVGKTSVASALGLLASRRGKKTLIAEVNAAERVSALFGTPEIGYEETKLAENLYAINIDPRSAFEEYVVEQIHSKKLFHLIFENRFVRAFLDATPGLNELLEIGKIWALTERDKDPSGDPKYDLVIIDAPATGHGLAFLNVPRVVTEAVRVGPLKTKAEAIMKLVQDPKKSQLLVVTLAEEMPVNEALEMIQSAQSTVKVKPGPVIANALYPSRLSDTEWKEIRPRLKKIEKEEWYPGLEKAVTSYQKKVLLQHFYLNKLQMRLGNQEVVELPYLFRATFDRNAIEELAEYFQASFDSRSTKGPKKRRRR
jgi:anion-transporting  ArsA/GET3 family ATPase